MSAARRTDSALRACALGLTIAVGVAATAGRAQAQGSVLLEGIADGEFWATNATSNLLTRNNGHPAALGRLTIWGAFEPARGLVFYAQELAEAGPARSEDARLEIYSNQFGARYAASRALVFDAGRLTPIIGTFGSRRFSTRNPLIGLPDGYALNYPLGVELSGETGHFDYRAAIVSLPVYHEGYVPTPTPRLRPAVGGGITPFVGLRIGGSLTAGPYLNRYVTATQTGGRPWTDFHQRVVALDATFSRGYLETHAEFAHGSYDVPGLVDGISGYTYYGEAKYTLSPRFFVAARGERNNYPFIRATPGPSWIAAVTDLVDGEIGAGYRVTASTLLKASVRGDRWSIRAGAPGFRGQGGHAIAVQLSQAFDVMDWLRPSR